MKLRRVIENGWKYVLIISDNKNYFAGFRYLDNVTYEETRRYGDCSTLRSIRLRISRKVGI
jgi:hypothetical protein